MFQLPNMRFFTNSPELHVGHVKSAATLKKSGFQAKYSHMSQRPCLHITCNMHTPWDLQGALVAKEALLNVSHPGAGNGTLKLGTSLSF